jgi:hypothetical protein
MDFNIEKNIMNNKSIESNAKKALSQYKLEISNELDDFSSNQSDTPFIGGLATRKLVQMGENQLLKQYQSK